MTSPFCSSSMLNGPLLLEVCQRIHAHALWRAARGGKAAFIPSSVPVARLRELMRLCGPETCLVHPTEIERLFQDITLSVYQWIEALYCSRVQRSIQIVTRIVTAQARRANRPPIHEEAIWAICLYLDSQREHEIRVTTKPCQAQWWLGAIAHSSLGTREDHEGQHTLVAVIDISAPSVLAFRVGPQQTLRELAALSLYDALVAARCPHPSGAGGLLWIVPSCLITTETLSPRCTLACASLGVRIDEGTPSAVPLLEGLRTAWNDLLTSGPSAKRELDLAFDSMLNRTYGTSPLRAREQANHRFRPLMGYQSDPACLVPALRTLLPSHDACISACGEVFFDGLHYSDDLLTLFPGASVSIRRSEQTEAVIWVSLDGEMLGEARARELARRDGSYRAHR